MVLFFFFLRIVRDACMFRSLIVFMSTLTTDEAFVLTRVFTYFSFSAAVENECPVRVAQLVYTAGGRLFSIGCLSCQSSGFGSLERILVCADKRGLCRALCSFSRVVGVGGDWGRCVSHVNIEPCAICID